MSNDTNESNTSTNDWQVSGQDCINTYHQAPCLELLDSLNKNSSAEICGASLLAYNAFTQMVSTISTQVDTWLTDSENNTFGNCTDALGQENMRETLQGLTDKEYLNTIHKTGMMAAISESAFSRIAGEYCKSDYASAFNSSQDCFSETYAKQVEFIGNCYKNNALNLKTNDYPYDNPYGYQYGYGYCYGSYGNWYYCYSDENASTHASANAYLIGGLVAAVFFTNLSFGFASSNEAEKIKKTVSPVPINAKSLDEASLGFHNMGMDLPKSLTLGFDAYMATPDERSINAQNKEQAKLKALIY
jgi:hypothetical protein